MAASDYESNATFNLELRGRRQGRNPASDQNNILPEAIGMERFKYSRVDKKDIIKFSLRSINLPQTFVDHIKAAFTFEIDRTSTVKASRKQQVFYRLKFQLGE